MNTISKGFECNGNAEFARFLIVAKGSCGEVRSLLYIAQDLNYPSDKDAGQLRDASISISIRNLHTNQTPEKQMTPSSFDIMTLDFWFSDFRL